MKQFLKIPVDGRGLSRQQLFTWKGIMVYVKVRDVSFHVKTPLMKGKNCANLFACTLRSVRWILVKLSLENQERSRLVLRNVSLVHNGIVSVAPRPMNANGPAIKLVGVT